MLRLYYIICWTLILLFDAGDQQRSKINCQSNFVNFSQNSKLTGQAELFKTSHLFNLTTVDGNDIKFLKVVKILQDNLSFAKLKSIERFIKIDTLILYDFSKTIFKLWRIFKENYMPRLITTNAINWQPKYFHNSNFLTIILLGADYPLTDEVFNSLKQSLKGFHLNKLIIIQEAADNNENAQRILSWLHTNGFWQSLLMDFEGNSLTLQHLTGELLWNLTIEEFLVQSSEWRNLLGFPINCSMASNPPRTYIQYDSQHNVILKGNQGSAISLFAKHYNASLKPFIVDNYTALDCVKYLNLNNNQVDICGDAFPIHEQYVVTYPSGIVPSYLMVPHDKPLPRFHYFLKPFQQNVWTVVIISFFYKVITLSIIHRLQQGSWNSSLHILYALLSVLYLPFQLTHVKRPYRRFLEVIMILVGFVVANWYLSILSSILFSRLYYHNIRSLQDLADHNVSIMVDELELQALNATDIDPIIMQQLKVVSNEILFQHRRNLDFHYAYYSQYDKVDFYLHQQKFLIRPRMKVLTGIPPINKILAGIPMNPNWPFQNLLNDFTLKLTVSGLLKKIYVKSMEEGIQSGYLHYFPTEYYYVEPLSIEYFQMPAMLLAAGYSVAFVGFLLELLVFKKN